MDELEQLRGRLLGWLREDALPLWETHGVDRSLGGYFETIVGSAGRGYEARGPIRRGRVVARQMFVFDTGRRLGWQATQPDPVRHGCEFLFSRMKRSDGLFHVAVDPTSALPSGAFDLYEYAFYLFSLARVHGELSADYPTHETASTCLALLRKGWGKSIGGFEESAPPSLPLKSNPHMHMFEAALAWIESTKDAGGVHSTREQAQWLQLATELCDLCLTRFIDARGAVREFFDASWRPMKDDSGRIVEPGHQFEWAWLLMQWAAVPQCPAAQRQACKDAALRLVNLGEEYGVDPIRGVAFNELWDDMTPKDASAKLWPQTERIKAWCSMLECAESAQQSGVAREKLAHSILGMMRYLDFEAAGLWHEVLLPDGAFAREPCKASSFYHIVCAIETLDRCLAAGAH
jgi:mannose/cellobiose epimerase-like protein (N-acyl-D-glucosamine 2-epimerase family)